VTTCYAPCDSVVDLVSAARAGDRQAWDALVERFSPLIWSICRRHQLSRDDAEDVSQSIWLRLVNHLDKIREPAALAGWLSTATRRECQHLWSRAVTCELDTETVRDERAGVDQDLLASERHAALREAFAQLPQDGQELIGMLIADPPVPYAEISSRLGIPVGSIGPTRSRCLDRMRRHPTIAALITAGAGPAR